MTYEQKLGRDEYYISGPEMVVIVEALRLLEKQPTAGQPQEWMRRTAKRLAEKYIDLNNAEYERQVAGTPFECDDDL